jgi:hypothetical protein
VAKVAESGHTQVVAVEPPNRIFLTDMRGGDQYLRATWHPESATIVFSHWVGEVCMASTPVGLTESAKLIDLQVRALSEVADRHVPPVVLSGPSGPLERLRRRLRPKLADVIDASARFFPAGRSEALRGPSR